MAQSTTVVGGGEAVAVEGIDMADVVSRIAMIFRQARKVFGLDENSGGYFCLADSETGQELVCVRLGSIPHNPAALQAASSSRERVSAVAGSSSALPADQFTGAVKYGGAVVAFVGVSPEIDPAITIAFTVSFLRMRPGVGNRVARRAGALSRFKSLFDRL